jgi:hypothetical protein
VAGGNLSSRWYRPALLDPPLQIRARRARLEVASGKLRGQGLLDLLRAIPERDRDDFVDVLLGIDGPIPHDMPYLPRGAVPYLPCAIDDVIAMVTEVPLREDDELVDLGSGLGRVAIVAHLLSGARARGVEIQGHLYRGAQAVARDLRLPGVSFVRANAAEVALDGSVFFLYAPFNGELMTRVLESIHEVAERRRVVVCSVGVEFPEEGWLVRRDLASATLNVYDARGFKEN